MSSESGTSTLALIMSDDAAPEVYDRAWVLTQLGGDELLLNEVIEVFLADAPRHEEELSRALASGECPTIRAAAHCIKSAVGNFGAENARGLAQRLEDACMANRRDALSTLAHELLRELAVLKRTLHEDLKRFS